MKGTASKEKPQGESSQEVKLSKPPSGILRQVWGFLGHLKFWHTNDDLEKRLQHLSKEEVMVHTRLKRRSQTWRKLARALVLYSVAGEILVLGIAIMATRSPGIPWQMRALRVFPVFALPALSALLYSSCSGYFKICERKDQKTLERLRAERQEKIDELKRKTNYYLTQQLIQKYDSDPTEKAAAASVLAAKLGAEAGLNVSIKASEVHENMMSSSSNKLEGASVESASGLKRRLNVSTAGRDYPSKVRVSEGSGNAALFGYERENKDMKDALEQVLEEEQHRRRQNGGGWLSRIAAMLVGEDPSQCYALICKRCHMHNGLAPKEDFQYITYFCPHCHTLNGNPNLNEGRDMGGISGKDTLRAFGNVIEGLSVPAQVANASMGLKSGSELDAGSSAATYNKPANMSSIPEDGGGKKGEDAGGISVKDTLRAFSNAIKELSEPEQVANAGVPLKSGLQPIYNETAKMSFIPENGGEYGGDAFGTLGKNTLRALIEELSEPDQVANAGVALQSGVEPIYNEAASMSFIPEDGKGDGGDGGVSGKDTLRAFSNAIEELSVPEQVANAGAALKTDSEPIYNEAANVSFIPKAGGGGSGGDAGGISGKDTLRAFSNVIEELSVPAQMANTGVALDSGLEPDDRSSAATHNEAASKSSITEDEAL